MRKNAVEPAWPDLSSPVLGPTMQTLQLWTQVVGKVRLAHTPWLNHSWQTALYVSARGLTTRLIPVGSKGLEIEFDLVAAVLVIRVTDGNERRLPLGPGSLATFHYAVMGALADLGAPTKIVAIPNELAEATPFAQDVRPRPYDAEVARAYWRALVQIDRTLNRFRTRFLGKCSPVHLFWGGFDLAVTRFSGRRAPLHPGGIPHLPDTVTREAYSHEVSSAGFWPGDEATGGPCFYAYAYPTPAGFAEQPVSPEAAVFDRRLGEFLLPYEAVRTAAAPEADLLSFLQTTYEAAATLAGWDRRALECEEGRPGRPRRVG